MRKILYISGTRADYGLMRNTLIRASKCRKLKIEVAATGMHLMAEFGRTIDEIKRDNIKTYVVKSVYEDDSRESMSNFIGDFIVKLTEKIKNIRPDMILVLGDRAEMLAGAIVGSYLMIPAVHIHGGDISSNVDEITRHAITKLSHIHLAATKRSAERIIKMGEHRSRVFVVGAPGLEDILCEELISRENIAKKYNLDTPTPFLLVTQHPESTSDRQASNQMRKTMEAIKELRCQAVVIYPNADSGGRGMIKIIEKYRKYSFIHIYKNIFRKDYISLMNIAGAIIGNSSSGIIEAPSFYLPCINIGSRQEGRERAKNVIDVKCNKDCIKRAIKQALYSTALKERLKKYKNPYGDGKVSGKIIEKLCNIKINDKLLQKRIAY